MLHDQSKDLVIDTAAATTRRVPTKVIDKDYETYCNLLMNGAWRYRAPHANRPTPPKRKWAWGMRVVQA